MRALSLLFFSLLSGFVIGQNIEKLSIYSKVLKQQRSLLIYKPSNYYKQPEKRFEVIYVFDSQEQEVFDLVHSALNFISPQSSFIVVGVPSPSIKLKDSFYRRQHDLLPEASDETIRKQYFGQHSNGNAKSFRKYLEEEVFALVDHNYRTLPLKVAIGHSNSATFVSYCLLENSAMFDAYLIQSPNLAYDNGQLVDRFRAHDFSKIEKKKFIFLSSANESQEKGWKGWEEAREKVYPFLQNLKLKNIHLEINEYPQAKHWNSFVLSCIDGLTSFINYQFRTGENVTRYYDFLAAQNLIQLSPDNIDRMAYECFDNGKASEAIEVVDWGIKKYPDDDNLYDSRAQFFESMSNNEKAAESYLMAIEALKRNKDSMDIHKFEKRLKGYQKRYNRVQ